jgi:proline iminopeptidase
MKKNIFRFTSYALLVLLIVFLYKIFWPRHYDVPDLQPRVSTKYWKLSTGSNIAYTFIAATGIKKPYPIMYLHGGPGGFITDRDIKTLQPLSENGYDIYLYDQVGGGRSGRLENMNEYTAERHINDLKEIIKNTGAEKIILIGQSWGAVLAVLFTAENPEKIDKVIFTSPGPIYPVQQQFKNVIAPDSLHVRKPFYSNNDGNEKTNNLRSRAIAFWATQFHKKLASDDEADNFAAYRNAAVNRSTVCDTENILKVEAGSGFYSALMTFKSLGQVKDPRSLLKKLNIPVLIIKGQCDNQPWGFTNEYLALFSNHQLTFIPGAGHFITIEQPALYLNAIKDFLIK